MIRTKTPAPAAISGRHRDGLPNPARHEELYFQKASRRFVKYDLSEEDEELLSDMAMFADRAVKSAQEALSFLRGLGYDAVLRDGETEL